MFLFAFCRFHGVQLIYFPGPTKVQPAPPPCKHAFSTHSDRSKHLPGLWQMENPKFWPFQAKFWRNWAKLFESYQWTNKDHPHNICASQFGCPHLQFVMNKCCFRTNVVNGYCVICATMSSVFVCPNRNIATDHNHHYLYLFPIILSLHWLWGWWWITVWCQYFPLSWRSTLGAQRE